ncbi:hypothetical protein AAMO2058_000261400 [Amorphochlora amoebiformis]
MSLNGFFQCFTVPSRVDWKSLGSAPNVNDVYKDVVVEPPHYDSNTPEVKLAKIQPPAKRLRSVGPKKKAEDPERARKLARKAQLARENRARKKGRLQHLEKEVKVLQHKLRCEIQHHQRILHCPCKSKPVHNSQPVVVTDTRPVPTQQAQPPQKSHNAHQAHLQKPIDSLILNMYAHEQRRMDSELRFLQHRRRGPQEASKIQRLVYSATDHRAKFWAHSKALGNCMEWSPPVRFMVWALRQNAAFFVDKCSLWNKLMVDILHLTPKQLTALASLQSLTRRLEERKQDVSGAEQKSVTGRSREDGLDSLERFEIECLKRIRGIMSPSQMLKFCVWTHQNQLWFGN